MINQLLYDLSTVQPPVTAQLVGAAVASADEEFALVTLSSPSFPNSTAKALVRKSWAPTTGATAVIGALALEPGTEEIYGAPQGTLMVQLASPDLGPGVASDESGQLWAAYRAASPTLSDLDLAAAIVAGAKAVLDPRGDTKLRVTMKTALKAAFPDQTPEPTPSGTPSPAPSMLPANAGADGLPAGFTDGQVVLKVPQVFGYKFVALKYSDGAFTIPTRVDEQGYAQIISALPLGSRARVVAWSTDEPVPGTESAISWIDGLKSSQAVVLLVPSGQSVIESEGSAAVDTWLANNAS